MIEKTPQKSETLVSKTEARIEKKKLLAHIGAIKIEHWVGIGEAIFLITLLLINFGLLFSFFGKPDETNVFSAPLIPILAQATSFMVPFVYGVRLWLLVLLLAFPVTFYFFVREITGRKFPAAVAALLISIPAEPFLKSRIELGLFADDGGQMAALTISAAVCLLLLRFIRQGGFKAGIIASLGIAAIALTSPLGLVILAFFALIITFSEMLLGEGRIKFLRLLTAFVLMIGFVAFWYHPGFVLMTIGSSQGELLKAAIGNLLPISFFALPIAATFGYLLFENRPQLQPLFLALFLTAGFGLIYLGGGVPISTPSRFLPAFGTCLAFLAGVVVMFLYDFLRESPKIKAIMPHPTFQRMISFGFPLVILLGCSFLIKSTTANLGELGYSRVLGLSAQQIVGVWEIRSQVSGIGDILGKGITLLTIGSVFVLKKKIQK